MLVFFNEMTYNIPNCQVKFEIFVFHQDEQSFLYLWKWLLYFNTIYESAFVKPLPFRCAPFYGPLSLKRWSRVMATHRTNWLSGSTPKWTESPSLQVYYIKFEFYYSL